VESYIDEETVIDEVSSQLCAVSYVLSRHVSERERESLFSKYAKQNIILN